MRVPPPLLLLGACAAALAHAATTPLDCDVEGLAVARRSSRYVVGRAHQRGAIFASCDAHGELSCFEDPGLADAPASAFARVSCDARTIHARRRKLGVAINLKEDKWPNGLVFYRFSDKYPLADHEKDMVRQAIAMYEATDLGVAFQECEPKELCKNMYVDISQKEDACYSYVGFTGEGGGQIMNLGKSCFEEPGTAVHELGHALGLYHEHTHPEREVIVLTDANLPVSASNYAKETDALFKPYDKASIMHYGRSAGLCLPKDQYPLDSFCDVEVTTNCVMPKKTHCNNTRNSEIGQRTSLSPGDLNTLKMIYGTQKPTKKPTQAPSSSSPSPSPSTTTKTPETTAPTTSQPPSLSPSPSATTTAPETTTAAPETTTKAPETTTKAPETTAPPTSQPPTPPSPSPSTTTAPPPASTTPQPSTTAPTSTEPATTTPTPTTTAPDATTSAPTPTTTAPAPAQSTTAPAPTTAAPESGTSAPTATSRAPATTTPETTTPSNVTKAPSASPTTTEPATTAPEATTLKPSTTAPVTQKPSTTTPVTRVPATTAPLKPSPSSLPSQSQTVRPPATTSRPTPTTKPVPTTTTRRPTATTAEPSEAYRPGNVIPDNNSPAWWNWWNANKKNKKWADLPGVEGGSGKWWQAWSEAQNQDVAGESDYSKNKQPYQQSVPAMKAPFANPAMQKAVPMPKAPTPKAKTSYSFRGWWGR